MGVAGAAWATSVSQLVSFVVLLVLNRRCAAIKVKLSRFTPQLHYFYKIFTGGVRGWCGVVLSYNFLPESKIYILVRGAFPVCEPRDVSIPILQ